MKLNVGLIVLMAINGSAAFAGESLLVTPEPPVTAPSHAEETVPPENWSLHFQATTVTQEHGSFNSTYSGPLSMKSDPDMKTSITSTLFLGRRLWTGGQFYINPELSVGSGLSDTHGVGGYPNGEIYRVDSPDLKVQVSRVYYEQVFGFGGEREKIEADKNQLAGTVDKSRTTFIFGKFSLNDFFDDNAYSHDPRTQFLNWAFMDNGAWDYAADTRGYTWGFYLEVNQESWALRLASVLEPDQANQMGMDMNIANAHGDNAELEVRYAVFAHPGKLRFLYYDNHAHMGSYREALAQSPTAPDITATRAYTTKYGFGINLEQELTSNLGFFSRWGWNDGTTETWAFTEIDSTFSLGLNVKGNLWNRENDNIGIAWMTNGLSQDHSDYLSAGGLGFIIGDAALNYAREQILEFYYLYKPIAQLGISADYQFVNHPAYNQDRGPINVFAGRLHYEF